MTTANSVITESPELISQPNPGTIWSINIDRKTQSYWGACPAACNFLFNYAQREKDPILEFELKTILKASGIRDLNFIDVNDTEKCLDAYKRKYEEIVAWLKWRGVIVVLKYDEEFYKTNGY